MDAMVFQFAGFVFHLMIEIMYLYTHGIAPRAESEYHYIQGVQD